MSKKIQNKTLNKSKTSVRRALSDLPVSSGGFVSANKLTLYRFVYATKTSFLVSLLLLLSFFVQGVQSVYANEESPLITEEVVVDVTSPVAEVESGVVVEQAPTEENTAEEQVEEQVEEPVEGAASEEVFLADESVEAEAQDSIEIQTEDVNSTDDEAPLDIEPNFDDSLSSGGGAGNDTLTQDEGSGTDTTLGEVLEEESTETVETEVTQSETLEVEEEISEAITDEDIELNHESVSINESDSAFSFASSECTQLATGSFYCQKPQKNVLQDALFSAPDADGDTEIFLVRDGVQFQITDNRVDDAAPYFDQNSNSIVWHRLINDRYQIISYDVTEQEERQLTQTSSNNMEPTRQGEYTVWQRWVDGGWNIILFDGQKETQITRTTSHNVAPYIHGSLIVWNRQNAGGDKTIEMYDMVSRTYVSVDDPDGMSVSNPRMVFVYDSLHPNGDIVTKGYDVLARKFIDLDTLPRELPDEIPDSDSTGETRALIQSKPSIKSEISTVSGSSTNPVVDLPLDGVVVIASSTETMTLDLADADIVPIEEVEQPAEVEVEVLDNDIPDLVIEAYLASDGIATTTDTVQE